MYKQISEISDTLESYSNLGKNESNIDKQRKWQIITAASYSAGISSIAILFPKVADCYTKGMENEYWFHYNIMTATGIGFSTLGTYSILKSTKEGFKKQSEKLEAMRKEELKEIISKKLESSDMDPEQKKKIEEDLDKKLEEYYN